jgi:hypothetical protein
MMSKKALKVTTVDMETLGSLHRVLLGHEQREMPAPWRCGFAFRDAGMLCGLRQREGGPCGVFAAVQAYVLRELLARAEAEGTPFEPQAISRAQAGEALLAALTQIIWAARVGRLATVVSCKLPQLPELRAAADELSATQCSSAAEVGGCLRGCLGAYTRPDGAGVALLLYSLCLTRGIAMVGRDADFPSPLIGVNGYCSQELVNLLLIGRAHSNVFDGEQSVGGDEGGEGGVRLRGVPRRAPVGFLTLFERQGAEGTLLTVGAHYKRPLAAVFVVQSESHYSVLWAPRGTPPDLPVEPGALLAGDPEPDPAGNDDELEPSVELADGAAFDLCYFDQMAERDDAVRLTVTRNPAATMTGAAHVAPLESVILTRWPAAQIDWNGEEVIL